MISLDFVYDYTFTIFGILSRNNCSGNYPGKATPVTYPGMAIPGSFPAMAAPESIPARLHPDFISNIQLIPVACKNN